MTLWTTATSTKSGPLGALALAPDRESTYSRNSTSGSPLKCGSPLTTFAPSDFAVA